MKTLKLAALTALFAIATNLSWAGWSYTNNSEVTETITVYVSYNYYLEWYDPYTNNGGGNQTSYTDPVTVEVAPHETATLDYSNSYNYWSEGGYEWSSYTEYTGYST